MKTHEITTATVVSIGLSVSQ